MTKFWTCKKVNFAKLDISSIFFGNIHKNKLQNIQVTNSYK